MTSHSQRTTATQTKRAIRIRNAMEVLWLVAAVLVPLAIAPTDWMQFYAQLPKVAALRIIAGLIAILWLFEWLLSDRSLLAGHFSINWRGWSAFRGWLSERPTRLIILTTSVFMAWYLVSTALSASFWISVRGGSTVIDGFNLYTMAAYFTIFLSMVTHMRSSGQVWRLIAAVSLMGGLASFVGLLERLEWLDIGTAFTRRSRIESTFGNTIFFGAVLTMTIPFTLALYVRLSHHASGLVARGRLTSTIAIATLGTSYLALQIMAMALTVSRGPMISLAVGMLTFLALGSMFLDVRTVLRAGAVLTLATILAIVSLRALPERANASQPNAVDALGNRFSNVYGEVAGGGLGNRVNIWRTSGAMLTEEAWLPGEDLPLGPLRPIIGYGPDLYNYLFPLVGNENSGNQLHAHNHIIHEAVELGIVGMAAYMSVLAAAVGGGFWLLYMNRRRFSELEKLVVVAILAALAGKLTEQMTGIPRAGDMVIFWMILAALVAVPAFAHANRGGSPQAPPPILAPGFARRLPKLITVSAISLGIVWTIYALNVNHLLADVHAARALQSDNPNDALGHADSAISLAPFPASYLTRRADVLRKFSDKVPKGEAERFMVQRAYDDRISALDVDPLSLNARIQLADAALDLARLGDKAKANEAIETYDYVMAMTPNYFRFHSEVKTAIAVANIYLDQLELAIAKVDEVLAVEQTPNLRTRALFIKGAIYYESDDNASAIEALLLALAQNARPSDEAQVHGLLAQIYLESGDEARAEYHLKMLSQSSEQSIAN